MIDMSVLLGQLSSLLWLIFAVVVLARIFNKVKNSSVFSSKN